MNNYHQSGHQNQHYDYSEQQIQYGQNYNGQQRFKTINHPGVDESNNNYHQHDGGFENTQNQASQVHYYQSQDQLIPAQPSRANSYDEARRIQRHQKYKRDQNGGKKVRQSTSQHHNRSVKQTVGSKNLVNINISKNHEKRSMRTELNNSGLNEIKKKTRREMRLLQEGRDSKESKRNRREMARGQQQAHYKSRTISPNEFSGSSGSTNLRQPLAFIQHANSGSLGPPEDRYSSKGRQNDIQMQREISEQQQLQQAHARAQKSLDRHESRNQHINSTAFFPGHQSYQVHDSNGQASIDFSRGNAPSSGQQNNFTGGPHQTPTLHYFSGQTNPDMGYGQDTMQVLSSIEHVDADNSINNTLNLHSNSGQKFMQNSTMMSEQANRYKRDNQVRHFTSDGQVLVPRPISPNSSHGQNGFQLSNQKRYGGIPRNQGDPLNDTREINKSYEDIRSDHRKSVSSNCRSNQNREPRHRRHSSSKSSNMKKQNHNREVSFQQLGFKSGTQVRTVHKDSLDREFSVGSQEGSHKQSNGPIYIQHESPYMNHQMLAPRHQQITSDSQRGPIQSQNQFKSTSRSKSMDMNQQSEIKRITVERNLRHGSIPMPEGYYREDDQEQCTLNFVQSDQKRPMVHEVNVVACHQNRVRSSSPRYYNRQSRVTHQSQLSPQGFQNDGNPQNQEARFSDAKSEKVVSSPRFSNDNEEEYRDEAQNYHHFQTQNHPHLNMVDQEEDLRQMMPTDQNMNLNGRITSGRQNQSSATGLGHFNTQDLVQLTSPDQMSNMMNDENQFYQETEVQRNPVNFRDSRPQNLISHTATNSGQNINGGVWGSLYTGSGMNTTKDARISDQIVHESLAQSIHQRNDTFRDMNQQPMRDGQMVYVNSGHDTPYLSQPHPKSPAALEQQQSEQQHHFITEPYGPGMTNSSNMFSPQNVYHQQDPHNQGNFTLSDLSNTQMSNVLQNQNQPFQATGQTYMGTVDSREFNQTQNDGATMAGTGPQKMPQALHSQNQKYLKKQLIQQEENLEKVRNKLLGLKFETFVGKVYVKQKMTQVHQTMSSCLQQMQGQRIDAYSNHGNNQPNYSKMSQKEIIQEIEKITKKITSDILSSNKSHQQFSRGLSKLSDIDSNFQISRAEGAPNPASQYNQMQLLEQQSMNSYHNAVNPNAANQSIAFKTLNGQGSESTFRSKLDVDNEQQELSQLRRYKEDSEAIINNLRKTIKDMAKQMKQLEIKSLAMEKGASLKHTKDSNLTPSLSNISPSKSTIEDPQDKVNSIKFLESQLQQKDFNTKNLKFELDQRVNELKDLKIEHEQQSKVLKEKFRAKFNEQNQFIEELKSELNGTVIKNQDMQNLLQQSNQQTKLLQDEIDQKRENQVRLESDVSLLQKQLNMMKSQMTCDSKTLESDKIRLQSSKEQEKHWKCGYETIFQKYSNLKEQMVKKEAEVRRIEWENDTKIKALTRKAEEAIKYFKELALTRSNGPVNLPSHMQNPLNARKNRFEGIQTPHTNFDDSRTTLTDDYKLRSRSAHAPLLSDNRDIYKYTMSPTEITRKGQVTPSRNYVPSNYSASKYGETDRIQEMRNSYRNTYKSQSPIREGILKNSTRIRQVEADQHIMTSLDGKRSHRLSPRAQGKLSYINKIQKELQKNSQNEENGAINYDNKLIFALEALEKAFQEINQFKRDVNDLSLQYHARHCNRLQDAQVLSFDYMKKIDEHLQRERRLHEELCHKDTQLHELRDVVNSTKRIIKGLLGQIKDQKSLKEAQWKNIISYDIVKDKEKRNMSETICEEVQKAKHMLAELHRQLAGKDRIIEGKQQEVNQQEQQRYAIENSLNSLRRALEDTQQRLEYTSQQRDELDAKLEQIENLIRDTLYESCGAPNMQHMPVQNDSRQDMQIYENTLQTPGISGQNLQLNVQSNDGIMDGLEPNANCYQISPPGQKRVGIISQETVINRQRNYDNYTNTKSEQSEQEQPPNSPPHLIGAIGPRLPLEWLSQIKTHIENQQSKIDDDAAYLQNLNRMVGINMDRSNVNSDINLHSEGLNSFQEKMDGAGNYILHVDSNNQSVRAASPRNMNPQAINKGDTLTQSLDSFIQNQGQPVAVNSTMQAIADLQGNQSYSQDLNSFAQQQQNLDTFGNLQGTEMVDEILRSKENTLQKSTDDKDLKCSLPQRIQQLLCSNNVKSKTILAMQQEIERLRGEYNQMNISTTDESNELQRQIQGLESEKNQLTQVYQQENQMRQELEIQVEDKTMSIERAQKQVNQCEQDLEQLQEQQNNLMLDKQKLEQSNEYWQNSFKLIEQHFLEQKDRADTDIANLTEQAALQDSELAKRNAQIQRMNDHIESLEEAWLPVKKQRDEARCISAQTDETCDSISNLKDDYEKTNIENHQIKRDIQVLIDSYENFKIENQRIQESQKQKIKDLEVRVDQSSYQIEAQNRLVIERLNNEIQEQIAQKQQKEDESQKNLRKLEEVEGQLRIMEQAKEEGELQLISQKDQIDQLNQFNMVVQNYNQQLQNQLQQVQSFGGIAAGLGKNSQSTFSNAYAGQSMNTQMSPKYFASSSPHNGMYDSRGSQVQLGLNNDQNLSTNHGSQSIGQFAGIGMTSFQSNNQVISPKIMEFVNQKNQDQQDQKRNSQFSFINGSRCREGSTQEMLESQNQESQKDLNNFQENEGVNTGFASSGAFTGNYHHTPTPTDQHASNFPIYSNQLSQIPSSNFGERNVHQHTNLNSLSGSQQTLPLHTNNQSSQHNFHMPLQMNQNHIQADQNCDNTQNQNLNTQNQNLGPMVDISTIERVNNTSLGLDMCQQCIDHEVNVQCQKDLIRKLICSYVQQARKLTSMCMEGAILLRYNQQHQAIRVKEHSVTSPNNMNKGQSYDFNNQTMHSSNQTADQLNLSILSEPEQKCNMIQQIKQFLENDIEKFIGSEVSSSSSDHNLKSKTAQKQEKLIEYANEMMNIAQHLVQNSCEIQLHYFGKKDASKDNLAQSQSLKIRDYQSVGSVQTLQLIDREVQVNLLPYTGEPTTRRTARERSESHTRVQNASKQMRTTSRSETPQIDTAMSVPQNVLNEIDELGVQLDNKIGIFVKLLMNLKEAQKKVKKDITMNKLIQSLTGAISKMIHELTGDTEALYNIKTKLCQNGKSTYSSKLQTQSQNPTESKSGMRNHTSRDQTESSQSNMPLAAPKASNQMEGKDPLSQTYGGNELKTGPTIKSERTQMVLSPPQILSMNFVNDDGRTVSDSQISRKDLHYPQFQHHMSNNTTPINNGAISNQIVSSHNLNSDNMSGHYYETTHDQPYHNQAVYSNQQIPEESETEQNEQNMYIQTQTMQNIDYAPNPMDDTNGVETLIDDISHLFQNESHSNTYKAKTDVRKSKSKRNKSKANGQKSLSRKTSISPRTYLNNHSNNMNINKHQINQSSSKGTYVHRQPVPDAIRKEIIPEQEMNRELDDNISSLDRRLQQNKDILKIIQDQQIYINTMSSQKNSQIMMHRMSSQSIGPNQLHMVQSQDLHNENYQTITQNEAQMKHLQDHMQSTFKPSPQLATLDTYANSNKYQQNMQIPGHGQSRTPVYKHRQEHKTLDFSDNIQNQSFQGYNNTNNNLNQSVSNDVGRHHHNISLRDPNIQSSQIYHNQSFFDENNRDKALSANLSGHENVFTANLSTISPPTQKSHYKSTEKTLAQRFQDNFDTKSNHNAVKENNSFSSPSIQPTVVPTRKHIVSNQLPPRTQPFNQPSRSKSIEHSLKFQKNEKRRQLKSIDGSSRQPSSNHYKMRSEQQFQTLQPNFNDIYSKQQNDSNSMQISDTFSKQNESYRREQLQHQRNKYS